MLLPVIAFGAVYLLFFTGDSPEEFTLSERTTTTGSAAEPVATATTVTTATLEGHWTVSNGSEAGYRVREKLASLPAQSDAVGRTVSVTGGFTLVRDGSTLAARDAAFEVDTTTLTSNESLRDDSLRRRGLQTDTFPTATFAATADVVVPAAAEEGEAATTEVTGDLTIHGVTQQVTIPLDVQRNGDRIEVVGSLTFTFADFGMDPPSGPLVTVENDATLEFLLFFARLG